MRVRFRTVKKVSLGYISQRVSSGALESVSGMTKEYREKAEKCRRLASTIADDPAAERLLEMAEHFEELALQSAVGNLLSGGASPQPAQQQQQPQAEDGSAPQ